MYSFTKRLFTWAVLGIAAGLSIQLIIINVFWRFTSAWPVLRFLSSLLCWPAERIILDPNHEPHPSDLVVFYLVCAAYWAFLGTCSFLTLAGLDQFRRRKQSPAVADHRSFDTESEVARTKAQCRESDG